MDEFFEELLICFGVVLFLILIIIGICLIQDKYEVKTFNDAHGTNYTLTEWFWSQRLIQNYNVGAIENKNYQVDLNLNDNRINGGDLI